MVRRTREDAQKTKEHILNVAKTLFCENGYEKTNLSYIAEKAGVTRGAIYWHFENKDELFMELWKYLVRKEDNFFEEFINLKIDHVSVLNQFESWLSSFKNNFNNEENVVFFKILDSLTKTNNASERVKQLILEESNSFIEKIKMFIQIAKNNGELPIDLDVELAGNYVFSVIHGYFHSYIYGLTKDVGKCWDKIVKLVMSNLNSDYFSN